MPELIERGHLYIAQPPLYKAQKGKTSIYLKDDRALEDYLIGGGIEGATLRLASGTEFGGAQLKALVEEARSVRGILHGLHSRYDRVVVEQAAIAGALRPAVSENAAEAEVIADQIARRLNGIADEIEQGWEGEARDGGYVLSRTLRGVKQVAVLDEALINSQEARRLDERAEALREIYGRPRDDDPPRRGDGAARPRGAVRRHDGAGPQGAPAPALQGARRDDRPAALGDHPRPRDPLAAQVKIKDTTDADDLFVKLMGDVVEPRREFIQENALNVANLDV